MRLVQVAVPTGSLDDVTGALEAADVAYVVEPETSDRDFEAVVVFPLPTAAVEPILDELESVGIDRSGITIISEASTVISQQYEALEEHWQEDQSKETIAREELRSSAKELLPSRKTYVLMTAISAIVATAGVLMDSAAVVVGSMVIAPLIGPALAASVGTVIDDGDLWSTGVRWQLFGVVLAVTSATAFALVTRSVNLVPPGIAITELAQIEERLNPDFLALAIALGAGVAGAFSLSTGVSAALVGVMIAVALIPPAAVIGVGLAWGLPNVVLGSSVLLALNVLAINLSALGVFWYQGYRPRLWFRVDEARSATIRRLGILAVAILAISVFLGVVTYASYESATQENRIIEAVDDAVASADGQLEVIDTRVTREDRPLLARPTAVRVTVSYPLGTDPPPLVNAIDETVADRIGRHLEVEVRYVEREVVGSVAT